MAGTQLRASNAHSMSQKNEWLQVLRAIAALMVVLFHASQYWQAIPALHPAREMAHWGFAGVDIFFVLSGYVVWTSADKPAFSGGAFLIRRGLRIYLGYWPVLALFVIWYLLTRKPEALPMQHAVGSVLLLNIWVFDNWLPTAWSLPYELYFYLWIALLCTAFPSRWRGLALLLVFLLLAGWTTWTAVRLPHLVQHNVQPFMFLATPLGLEFLGGALLARGHVHLRRGNAHWRTFMSAVILLGLALAAIGFSWGQSAPAFDRVYVLRTASFGLFGFGLVLAVLAISELNWRAPRFLVAIGDSSYSLYLIHPLLFVALNWLGQGVSTQSLWRISLNLFNLVAVVFLAWQWYLWVEKPVFERATRRKNDRAHDSCAVA